MIGKYFILAGDKGQILSTGMIEDRLSEGTYLARFRGNPPVSRVVSVEIMDNWLIFEDERHLAAWMDANVQQAQAEQMPPDLVKALQIAAAEGDEKAAETLKNAGIALAPPEKGEEVKPEDVPNFDPESPLTPVEQLADHEAEQSRAS